MKVRTLISILERQNPELEVEIVGCDLDQREIISVTLTDIIENEEVTGQKILIL